MGLAASQARYLTLTSRKSDLELQSQTINSRRIQLSYKTAAIARAYSEAMNNKRINIQVASTTTDGTVTKAWSELTFQNLLDAKYMLIGSNGKALKPSPYNIVEEKTNIYNRLSSGESENLTETEYKALPASDKDAFITSVSGETKTYKLKNSVSEDIYTKLSDKYKQHYNSTPTVDTHYICEVNPDYSNGENAQDIQTLLTSGQAQIVTADFFDYLVQQGAYEYSTGISAGGSFAKLLDEWQKNNETSIIDWRSDESSTFKQKNYTEDDEAAIAQYEADNAEVQAQDKILEVEEKNIETQHKAIETELENVKKVIQKNIEDTFKIFS